MIILLKSGQALAFPQAAHAEYKSNHDNSMLRLILKRKLDDDLAIAEFNYDAVAGVIVKDEDYADLLAAAWARNVKSPE